MRTNEGHRKRVKDRFLKEGLENFEEAHALELLLFYAVPRKDTKPLARKLLDRFGSFAKVLEADTDALMQVEGVGIGVATYISLLNDTNRYYMVNREKAQSVLHDLNACGQYLVNFFVGKGREEVYLLCLDGKSRVLGCHRLNEGSVGAVDISLRSITEIALGCKASSVILAHNHPDGLLLPSESDVVITKRIAAMLEAVEVKLVDHIVVGGGKYLSMVQSGHFDPDGRRLFWG